MTPPRLSSEFHVGRPNIGDRESFFRRLSTVLDRRWLTNRGEMVQEFEARVADYLGVKHCVAMCNGTIALEIAVRALGLKGEVIVPSFTFIATAHALQWQEITPVFCDVDPNTHNLCPEAVRKLITPRTSGILGVHVWGRPCATEGLSEIAAEHDLKVVYDAAHAFGCSCNGTMIGNFGECEVLSFHATKFFNTFEGGAIVTNNDELATKARLMQNFGFESMDKVVYIGTNGKMNEMCAAMGLTNFESIEEFIDINRQHYFRYKEAFDRVPGVNMVVPDVNECQNYQYVVVEIDQEEFGMSRDALMQYLHTHGVRARRYFYPGCHRMEPYRTCYPYAGEGLPHTEALCDRVLVFPTGTTMTAEDITAISRLVTTAFGGNGIS